MKRQKNNNKNRISFIILCIIVLLTTTAYGIKAKLPEPNYDFYVYDEAGIIDKNAEDYIININKELYKKTGGQIVIAAVNSLEDMDINYYATALFEEWEIGSKEYDNGMLILVVPNDKEIWIEVGYGLEGQFPDSKTKRIIENYIIPYFSEGSYSDGLLAGFNQILIGFEEEYNISLDKSNTIVGPPPSSHGYGFGYAFPRIFIIIGIIIFLFIDFKFFRGMITYSLFRGIGRGGGGGFGGSSGGGRSSGGGGRSGGGGAGGKW